MIGGMYALNNASLDIVVKAIVSSLEKEGKKILVVLRDKEMMDVFINNGFIRQKNWIMTAFRIKK